LIEQCEGGDDGMNASDFETIGIHVGSKDGVNYATALTRKLFFDQIYPAMEKFF
jgi:hypothetical protein